MLDSGLDRLQLQVLSFNFSYPILSLVSFDKLGQLHGRAFFNLVAFKLARASLILHETEHQRERNREGCSIYCTSCQIKTFCVTSREETFEETLAAEEANFDFV